MTAQTIVLPKRNFADFSAASFTNSFSVDFDGINQYGTIVDTNSLSFTNDTQDTAFSVSAWVFMDDATNFHVFSKGASATPEYICNTSGTDKFSFSCFDTTSANSIVFSAATASTALEGTWAHIVFVYDGTAAPTGFSIFINNVGQGGAGGTFGTYASMKNLSLGANVGRYFTDGASYSNGKMDEISVYSIALSASQVSAIYNSGVATRISTLDSWPYCVSWWRNGDGPSDSSAAIYDLRDLYNNTITLVNSPTISTSHP